MSDVVNIKIPERIREEADFYVKSGYFDTRSELIREAIREYLEGLRGKNVEVVVELYRKGHVSLGKAAELSGKGYEKMKEFLVERGIPIQRGPETVRDARQEYEELGDAL